MNEIKNEPGCYLFKDENDKVIYVGKAINLKKRVSSYFNKKHLGKTKKMVSEIKDMEYFLVKNETEALILELNLIKKYKPKYNILLRDDKTYPYIELTNDKVPVLKVIRQLKKTTKNRFLFGPYPNVLAARTVVNLLNRIYPLRKCQRYPKKPCLYYYIGQCKGFCFKEILVSEIEQIKKEVIFFLNGNHQLVSKKIKEEMKKASKTQNYEQANELKKLLTYIEITLAKQKVEINQLIPVDVIGYYFKDNYLATQVLFIRGGKIVDFVNQLFEVVGEKEDQIINYLASFYDNKVIPSQIIVNLNHSKLLTNYLGVKIIKPGKGNKLEILKMANHNAEAYYYDKIKNIKNNETEKEETTKFLKKLLNIESVNRIEMFDNSSLYGNYAVSGMVVFEDMRPLKNQYRKFKIKDQHDDYNNLREVIYRRYYRLLIDNQIKPNLIMVDGGKGQVKVTESVLDSLKLKIPVVGIFKDDKHQTAGLIFKDEEYKINKQSSLFNFISLIQAEVHRFTINYHRKIRTSGGLESSLDSIKYLGVVGKQKLLKEFKTLSEIKKATDQQLLKLISKKALSNLRIELGSEFDE